MYFSPIMGFTRAKRCEDRHIFYTHHPSHQTLMGLSTCSLIAAGSLDCFYCCCCCWYEYCGLARERQIGWTIDRVSAARANDTTTSAKPVLTCRDIYLHVGTTTTTTTTSAVGPGRNDCCSDHRIPVAADLLGGRVQSC